MSTAAELPRAVALVAALALLGGLAGCASATKAKPAPTTAREAARAQVEATIDPMKLQSGLLALADTCVQRVASATAVEGRKVDAVTRERMIATRLALSSALFSIATGPDQIDALLDMLTHTALTAEAQRNAAAGKPGDDPDASLKLALDRNEADAWALAGQWLTPEMLAGLRARIAALPLERKSAGHVAFVRLADLPRGGSATIDSGDGISDSLRAATQQADQVRLLAERSLFLMQRMPFLMRWQAQAYSYDTLALDETQQLLKQLGELSIATAEAARVVAALPATASRERAAALEDLFTRIRLEREAAIQQLLLAVREERSAALQQVGATVAAEREATFLDLGKLVGDAETRGSSLLWVLVLAGVILIVVFMAALLAMLLLYRKFVPKVGVHPTRA